MSTLGGEPVLVLGGLGFIGANLTGALAAAGAKVTVVTPAAGRHADRVQAFARDGVAVVEGDIRDAETMRRAVAGQRVVFNLSGQSGAVRSMEDPWTDLDVNCRGNLVLLESLRAVNREARVVFAGSRLEYGHVDVMPVAEHQFAEPLCLHAVHKRMVEEYLGVYHRLFGIPYSVARITNPYGPGQPPGRTAYGIINRMIQLALSGDTIPIYGDGAQRRDYVHVDDVVAALIALAESPRAAGTAFNVGSGTGTSLAEAAETIIAIAGGGRIRHVEWPALARQVETGDFIADIGRIEREVGWRPAVPFRAGLEQTVAHYRAD